MQPECSLPCSQELTNVLYPTPEKSSTYPPHFFEMRFNIILPYTGHTQKNGEVSKVNKKFMSHITRAQHTPSAAATVQVSHALPAVRFSCLLRGRGDSFKDGVAAGQGFMCAPF
jgi:hypothetical protein